MNYTTLIYLANEPSTWVVLYIVGMAVSANISYLLIDEGDRDALMPPCVLLWPLVVLGLCCYAAFMIAITPAKTLIWFMELRGWKRIETNPKTLPEIEASIRATKEKIRRLSS